ncbi:MAG TPA: copper resistance protein B [Longimicrobiales bacterium]
MSADAIHGRATATPRVAIAPAAPRNRIGRPATRPGGGRIETRGRRARAAARAAVALGALLLAVPGRARAQEMPDPKGMMRWGTESFLLLDELEAAPGAERGPVRLEATGWIGGAFDRFWFRADAEQLTRDGAGAAEVQLLYGRLVSSFWDAQVGVRIDRRWGGDGATRAHLALGLEGLAPYWFELAPTLFISQDGDVSARLEASYELLLTQRLIAEPELELNAALQEVPAFGVARGVDDVGLGVRLRYEIARELAPYIGFAWTRRFGGGADLARAEGEPVSDGAFVAGVRVWY